MKTIGRILRNAFGTVTAIYLVAWYFLIANMDRNLGRLGTTLEQLTIYAFYLVHIPAVLALIIVSVYSYITKRAFKSVFGKEYSLLFVSFIPFIIGLMSLVAIP